MVARFPGISVAELTGLIDQPEGIIEEAIGNVRHLVLIKESVNERHSEAETEMLESLRIAGTMAFPLSTDEYDELRRKGFVQGLSSMRFIQVFGTWRRACELADVEAPAPMRANYQKRWTERELAQAVARYLVDPEFRGVRHRYDEWRSANLKVDEIPSAGTLLNELGRQWRTVQNRGLEILREAWLSEYGVVFDG